VKDKLKRVDLMDDQKNYPMFAILGGFTLLSE